MVLIPNMCHVVLFIVLEHTWLVAYWEIGVDHTVLVEISIEAFILIWFIESCTYFQFCVINCLFLIGLLCYLFIFKIVKKSAIC